MEKIQYHLPGLFEFYELYRRLLPLYKEHPEYFYDWFEIGSIYGAPSYCLWGGGRISDGQASIGDVLSLMEEYEISSRLTFSNSLLEADHLQDVSCNELCKIFEAGKVTNGVIVHSERLLNYLMETYPDLYFVSSTTKVLLDPSLFLKEINREEFRYVVPDFRFNKKLSLLDHVDHKEKIELLCNECCDFGCMKRKECYEAVSEFVLGKRTQESICPSKESGYRFSKAMENPGFISVGAIQNVYRPLGISNFKIEGRGLGSAMVFEMLLYYMVKPAYQIYVREALYLENMLDLF